MQLEKELNDIKNQINKLRIRKEEILSIKHSIKATFEWINGELDEKSLFDSIRGISRENNERPLHVKIYMKKPKSEYPDEVLGWIEDCKNAIHKDGKWEIIQ